MIIYGGKSHEGKILNDLWVLELSNMRWIEIETKGEYPPPLYSSCSTIVIQNERQYQPSFSIFNFTEVNKTRNIKYEGIYLFGGCDDKGKNHNDIFVLRIGKRRWDWIRMNIYGPKPDSRRNCTLNYYENLNILLLYGGRDEFRFFNDFYLFDVENEVWIKAKINELENPPIPRAEHCSFILDQKLIIFGGINENSYLGSEFYMINLDLFENRKRLKMIRFKNMEDRDYL